MEAQVEGRLLSAFQMETHFYRFLKNILINSNIIAIFKIHIFID